MKSQALLLAPLGSKPLPHPCRTFDHAHRRCQLSRIGNRGTILQSGNLVMVLEGPVFVLGTGFRLPFRGVLNHAYQMQMSTNLVNWTSLLTITNFTEHSQFTDTNALQMPRRFYRLTEP